MGTLHAKGKERNFGRFLCPVQDNALILSKFRVNVIQNSLLFPLYGSIGAHGPDHLDGRNQRRSRVEVLRAGFELLGKWSVGGAAKADGLDHLSPAHVRRHGLQPFSLSIKDPGSGGGIQLVTGEGIEVAIQRLNVNRLVNNALCTVHKHRNAFTVAYLNDFPNRIYKP